MSSSAAPVSNDSKQQEVWFDDLVANLRSHELQLATDTAPQELRTFYETLMAGNMKEIFRLNKSSAQQFFVSKILVDYLKTIKDVMPLNLAFDFNDSEVLVWAEIEDDNEQHERELLKAEAQINSIYHQYGFDMETTIVENGDQLSIPSHFKVYR